MKEENNKKIISTGEAVLWMIITAATVFVATSIQYTKMTLGNDSGFSSNLVGASGERNFEKLNKVLAVIDNEFLYDYDMKKLEEGAIRGMLEALEDPYTSYFDMAQTDTFLKETEGEYEGVGLYLAEDFQKNMIVVLTPIGGSPAEEAGILPGDYVEKISGENMEGATLEEVATKIRGVAGSSVKLTLRRYKTEDEYEVLEKELVRRNIDVNPFSYRMIDDNIAYVSFTAFDERADKQFKNAIEDLKAGNDLKGIIIDVRDNSGGIVGITKNIIDDILPTGIITYAVDKNGNKEYMYSDSQTFDLPVVLLVDEYSASASEIMAGAIKAYDKGAVVGKTTYGKGLIQEFKSLKDGTYIKVTIAEYFSPEGEKINKIGVEPDYIVENNEETEVDEQYEKAVEVMKNMINK